MDLLFNKIKILYLCLTCDLSKYWRFLFLPKVQTLPNNAYFLSCVQKGTWHTCSDINQARKTVLVPSAVYKSMHCTWKCSRFPHVNVVLHCYSRSFFYLTSEITMRLKSLSQVSPGGIIPFLATAELQQISKCQVLYSAPMINVKNKCCNIYIRLCRLPNHSLRTGW